MTLRLREQRVAIRQPKIRVIDALECKDILSRSEFIPEVSVESPFRREFYRNQSRRNIAQGQFSGEYLDFLKSCNIKLSITHGFEENLDRIHELVQRTNQMNFSGNRYSKDQLREILNSGEKDTYTLHCADKFGDYETVGFCVVDTCTYTIIDLAFSCRVQSKRVEHAFVNWLLGYYQNRDLTHFSAIYKKTARNTPSEKVFPDLGFEVIAKNKDIIEFRFDYATEISKESLIDIRYQPQR